MPKAPPAQEEKKAPAKAASAEQKPAAVPEKKTGDSADALALAQKSGCLACHNVDKKIVGPAWKDVAARYKGDAGAKDKLIAKVKTGGKGNWTEVTGGMAMPPYSPRVADADIEKLVTFVLSLK
ncbi:MAG: c-type cytochrome [Gammaproteobacteria bacterium]|nr:c-type cytochrome [Gammaproteobacteria bacterium]